MSGQPVPLDTSGVCEYTNEYLISFHLEKSGFINRNFTKLFCAVRKDITNEAVADIHDVVPYADDWNWS